MKSFDNSFRTNKNALIAGVDEAGRGPLAGPVVAASVIFPVDYDNSEINDSKKLSAAKREILFNEIIKNAITFGYCEIDNCEIDRINILKASLLAMKKSAEKLTEKPEIVLIDGNKSFAVGNEYITVVKGDAKSLSIAAASIIAKVIRDEIMKEMDKEFPQYNWAKNKGYPTKEHFEAIDKFGLTPYHRKTFLKKHFQNVQLSMNF